MATAPVLLPIKEYLTTSYHPDVHFVDGEIEERNVGEHTHSTIQKMLLLLFGANEERWNVEAFPEQRIRVNSSRVRVCDVAVLKLSAPWEEVTQTPPLMCIEVMSPEDRLSRAKLVLADYYAMGIKSVWLIDPYKRLLHTFDSKGFHVEESGILSVFGSEIAVDLKAMFQKLDEKRARR